jgi:hypothetical protein
MQRKSSIHGGTRVVIARKNIPSVPVHHTSRSGSHHLVALVAQWTRLGLCSRLTETPALAVISALLQRRS